MSGFLIALAVAAVIIIIILYAASILLKRIDTQGKIRILVCTNPLCKHLDIVEYYHNVSNEDLIDILQCPECSKTRQIIAEKKDKKEEIKKSD